MSTGRFAICTITNMERSMFSREVIESGQARSVTVTRTGAGWEVREECQHQLVRSVTYSDWHRVERAMELFSRRGPAPEQPS